MNLTLPPITNRQLYQQALTHRSYANEHPQESEHNERLEFLGDAVLGFLVGELLYQRYPEMSEAQLTRLRSVLVDEQQLAQFARIVGVGTQMRLGKGADKDGGRDNPALLSDTFEALIGAYFLDSGIDAVRSYITALFLDIIDRFVVPQSVIEEQHLVDSKNRLQQWALAQFQENPQYEIIAEFGPDHSKTFTAQVRVQGNVYGVGTDRRKQEAEKRAAEDALKKLGIVSVK
ncbi:ribonuclease III [Lusitaniella coriacea LEGE 07157]|uniref:Ribonuclease 3 n=1 Tax=Lusitaniella coriacea LEGE 07157 TaxID=945747 RepID=A0A8J7DXE3_9CYAN|nr:ribonuclease III [Lusitaniella coriacea]MBE9117127.1 ribonuclease III [Lusitaniella coriacea LEGE 07157]